MPGTGVPVVFVHGLWLHADSWGAWLDAFGEAGYDASAPGWPGEQATVEEARRHPEQVAGHGIDDAVAAYTAAIRDLPSEPVAVGHASGGIVVQRLLAEGTVRAAVAIESLPIKGIRTPAASPVRVGWVALRNPLRPDRSVALTRSQFRYAFGNAITTEESDALFERWAVPSPAKPLFEVTVANLVRHSATAVDTAAPTRGPLLLVAGGRDNAAPLATTQAIHKVHAKSPAVTDYHAFPDRGHSITIDSGWRDVADDVLDWLGSQRL